MIAPKQSATQLRRNLMQAKGSPEQHKRMDPAQLRLIQRRVQAVRQTLTKQKLDTLTVPESLGEITGWCATQDFHAVLRNFDGNMCKLETNNVESTLYTTFDE
jgi:hypothetical protein